MQKAKHGSWLLPGRHLSTSRVLKLWLQAQLAGPQKMGKLLRPSRCPFYQAACPYGPTRVHVQECSLFVLTQKPYRLAEALLESLRALKQGPGPAKDRVAKGDPPSTPKPPPRAAQQAMLPEECKEMCLSQTLATDGRRRQKISPKDLF